MKEIAQSPLMVDQLEEALEERQKPDRRSQNVGFNPETKTNRRKFDRRTSAKSQAATKH